MGRSLFALALLLASSPSLWAAPTVPEVDEVEITAVVDNFYDCFQRDEKCATRHNVAKVDGFDAIRLQAEMGLAFLIRVRTGAETHTILFDFGLTPSVYENNLRHLQLDLQRVEALVLSHAHEDHYAALELAARRTRAPVYVGDGDAFLARRFQTPSRSWSMGTLSRKALESAGSTVVMVPEPRVIAGGVLLSGRIPQKTPYEKVPPFLKMERDGKLVQDPMTHELAIAFRVKGKGLVVITSCAHAGLINTIEHVKAVTGEQRVLAVLGGMHLTSAPDDVVDQTVAALAAMKPTFVAPMHCTGNRAIERLVTTLPAAYVHPSVGTRYRFAGN